MLSGSRRAGGASLCRASAMTGTKAPDPIAAVDGLSVAVAHEWVSARAGSERVFERIAALLPSADLFALTVQPGIEIEASRDIGTTVLDRSWLRDRRAFTLPIMPAAWAHLRRSSPTYDVVLTSSHAFARVFGGRRSVHLDYCHTPLRLAWAPEIDARAPLPEWVLGAIRRFDAHLARHVDSFAANSTFVRERIGRAYGKEARVIPPPVDVDYYADNSSSASVSQEPYGLAVSRFVPYKGLALAIRASHAARRRLVIAGSGSLEASLRQLAKDLDADVDFVISPPDDVLRSLYAQADYLLYPCIEDFGIVPVEAMAAGTPVISVNDGGVMDTVHDGRSGLLVNELTPVAFAQAISDGSWAELDRVEVSASVQRFNVAEFDRKLREWVTAVLAGR